ncbi:MAG TPA: hypothetical protein VIS96_01195, partial [Terrimicrobiaceae bacterium]
MAAGTDETNREERQLFSGDIVAHTVESIVALDTEWRLRTLYFTTLLICVAAIAAIFVVKVDVSAMGAGLIRPLTDKMEISSPLAGQVVEIVGRTDLRVKRGDRLMVLSTASLEASLASNRAEQERAVRELHDLDFLVRLLGEFKPLDSRGNSPPAGAERASGRQEKRTDLEPKKDILIRPISASPSPESLLQSPVYAKDYVSYLAEADELRSNREQAEHELRRYRLSMCQILSRVRTWISGDMNSSRPSCARRPRVSSGSRAGKRNSPHEVARWTISRRSPCASAKRWQTARSSHRRTARWLTLHHSPREPSCSKGSAWATFRPTTRWWQKFTFRPGM